MPSWRLEDDGARCSPAWLGKSCSSRSSACCDCAPGIRKLSLVWPSRPIGERDDHRPRRRSSRDEPPAVAHRAPTEVVEQCRHRCLLVSVPCCAPMLSAVSARPMRVALIRNARRPTPCEHGPVPVEFVALPSRGRVFRAGRRVHLGDVDGSGRLRLEALARYLQDVATDDADDAKLSERRGVWVVRSHRPRDHRAAAVPRSGRAGDVLQRYRAVLGRTAHAADVGRSRCARRGRGVVGLRRSGAAAARSPLDDDFSDLYGESAGGRRVSGRLVHDRAAGRARRRGRGRCGRATSTCSTT